ncbi:LLM class flavin-dependent oxidoreductase [Streptomyces endophyticus]|uniref:LLM class flavin-dependent oxidoreductase n=1 Tax=Streptomyces endophyticus TaxID=714166 RepID=A0ABU6FGY6_9ACTN|nr:LLM class flavin-dependent oxidoreductase [Streptomyces endophyticus]MEB8342555.1 LLM class flavin-dependent oxidoreductase [Streptomyces endophyticus]
MQPPQLPARFGAFLAPYHGLDGSPSLRIRQDLDLVRALDACGYDEAWIGEHHSAGYETIASPEVFIAAAAELTHRIRLGTGVNSLPYHHPLMLADRLLQLDHQTRGRVMLGAGPGQLASDAFMMGIDPMKQRAMMAEALDAIVRLVRGETVTEKTDWYELAEAHCQLGPYRPVEGLEMAVASTVSPSGSVQAGRHGIGLLSLAAGDPAGFAALRGNWEAYEKSCARHGHVADRADWRLVVPMHLADTREQARSEAAHGVRHLVHYIEGLSGATLPWGREPADAVGQFTMDGFPVFGVATIGTPDDAIARVEALAEASGGFGTLLLLDLPLATPQAKRRSYELFADHVVPHCTGANTRRAASMAWAHTNSERFVGAMRAAVEKGAS